MGGFAVWTIFILISSGVDKGEPLSSPTPTHSLSTEPTTLDQSTDNPTSEQTSSPSGATAEDREESELILCRDVLCEIHDGVFILNTSQCFDFYGFTMNTSYEPATVHTWTDREAHLVNCKWNMPVPKQHRLILTVDQLPSPEGSIYFGVVLGPYDARYYSLDDLSKGSLNLTLDSNAELEFQDYDLEKNLSLTFHHTLVPIVLRGVQLSNWTGYVISPDFDYEQPYPNDYDGTYDIDIPDNYSVIVKFTHFELEPGYSPGDCDGDYLMIYDLHNRSDTVWKKCGSIDDSIQVFRFPIQLRFVSDSYSDYYSGFKMLYTVLPTEHEPVLVTEYKYDCSVPHFDKFSHFFRCNFIPECENGEDEEDCEYQYAPVKGCDEVLCQTGSDLFVIDTTSCVSGSRVYLHAKTERTTVAVMVDPENDEYYIDCPWDITVPDQHHVVLTFPQTSADLGDTTLYVKDCLQERFRCGLNLMINATVLENDIVNVSSLVSLYFEYIRYKPYSSGVFMFEFYARVNVLPTEKLSETLGVITSPNFYTSSEYPQNYHGAVDIQVTESFFVLLKIAFLSIQNCCGCEDEFVSIYETHEENRTNLPHLCGYHVRRSVFVYNSTVRVQFKSSLRSSWRGFRIIYTILPVQFQSQFLSQPPFNCSVSFFSQFQALLSCDLLVECQGMEDETGCAYSNNTCGPGVVEAGDKCYSFNRPNRDVTWYTANAVCQNKQQQLVTLADQQSLSRLQEIITSFDLFDVYVGLQLSVPLLPAPMSSLYRAVWQWVDGRSAFTVNVQKTNGWNFNLTIPFPLCTIFIDGPGDVLSRNCFDTRQVDILCEFDKPVKNLTQSRKLQVPSSEEKDFTFEGLTMVQCPVGHVTREFLQCDSQSQCMADSQSCKKQSNTFPTFQCESGEHIPYTLVCDHISHCSDASDEDLCSFELCTHDLFQCQNQQCIDLDLVCDGVQHCFDKSDEICQLDLEPSLSTIDPPAMINFTGNGRYILTPSSVCPDTHFSCFDGYCLPVFLRCNGIADCVAKEDEEDCDSYTCEGFYRCRGSTVCLHPQYMCDGLFHCPQYDDESMCEELTCPQDCACQGYQFTCTGAFPINSFPQLRYLDVTNTTLTTRFISQSWQLVGVRLFKTGITEITALFLPDLQLLDLSHNEILFINLQSLVKLRSLRTLILRGNPLHTIESYPDIPDETFYVERSFSPSVYSDSVSPVKQIDLSRTQLEIYNGSTFNMYPQLEELNVSHSKLYTILDGGFLSTPKLKHVDLSNSHLKNFPNQLLKDVSHLESVYADTFILCCEAMLPEGFDQTQCHAEEDLLASCDDLLRSDAYRIFLWLFASLSVIGNVGSFIARIYLTKEDKKLGSFSIFVTNLCLADFLMGVYLSIIGVADQVYQGEYLFYKDKWTHSGICSFAGFLSLLSSEVSAFTICLITLDRFLVLCFPFSKVHFQKRSSLVACVVIWGIGILLAGFPLLPFASHWHYYSQTSICIPLPFSTSDSFKGYTYSFVIMIVVNFILFLLIAVGQALIFWSVRRNTMAAGSSSDRTSRNAVIARRLTTVVVSDFLCWFPIGVLGLLHSTGTLIPAEISVAVAIFVLPLNSALNPFLYTFNTVMEKRQKATEQRLLSRLKATLGNNSSGGSATKKSVVNSANATST